MPPMHWSSWIAIGICILIGVLSVAFQWPWWIALASVISFPVLAVLLTVFFTARRRDRH